nr:LysR family transcriptional regulator [Geminicoccus harenae]
MDLVALADFNAVASSGGFAAASRTTGIPKATLSRRIRTLEAELGTRLFERGGRELHLTEEGLVLHRRIGPLLAELVQSGEEISGRSGVPRGRLRVSVPVLLANLVMGRIAAGFVAAFPEIDLEIIAEDRAVDPVVEGFDVVIRACGCPRCPWHIRQRSMQLALPSCRWRLPGRTSRPAGSGSGVGCTAAVPKPGSCTHRAGSSRRRSGPSSASCARPFPTSISSRPPPASPQPPSPCRACHKYVTR